MKYDYHRVRDLREDKDLTQANLADFLGVHTTQYRRWETGESEIPAHIIIKLASFYKVSTDYILGLKDQK
ncbi:MAG: helix-turn-helix transcriptional regulator [Clostridia bacterium]|nr:helix-turn-helix transcriptional regulator [Clostridia bacterium]